MYISTIFVFLCCLYSANSQLPNETVHQDFACFGTIDGQMDATCATGNKIAPISVITGTKLTSLGCPTQSGNTSYTSLCCRLSANDCTGEYVNVFTPNNTYIYHRDCVGLQQCPGRLASRMDRSHLSCAGNTSFHTQTIYMYLNYHCIPDSRIGVMSSSVDISATNEALYLIGQNYPSEISMTSASCSVESDDCGATIQVWLIDLRLDDVTSGSCAQSLNISGTIVDCADNNDFQIKQIPLQTMENNIEIHFEGSVLSAGFFWIAFISSESGDSMTLKCPAVPPQHSCTTIMSTTEELTSTEVSTTEMTTLYNGTTYNYTIPIKEKEKDPSNRGTIIGASLGSIAVVIVIVVVIVIYCKCFRGNTTKTKRGRSDSAARAKKGETQESPVCQSKATLRNVSFTAGENGNSRSMVPARDTRFDPVETQQNESEEVSGENEDNSRHNRQMEPENLNGVEGVRGYGQTTNSYEGNDMENLNDEINNIIENGNKANEVTEYRKIDEKKKKKKKKKKKRIYYQEGDMADGGSRHEVGDSNEGQETKDGDKVKRNQKKKKNKKHKTSRKDDETQGDDNLPRPDYGEERSTEHRFSRNQVSPLHPEQHEQS